MVCISEPNIRSFPLINSERGHEKTVKKQPRSVLILHKTPLHGHLNLYCMAVNLINQTHKT
jgi:hypothetical protein